MKASLSISNVLLHHYGIWCQYLKHSELEKQIDKVTSNQVSDIRNYSTADHRLLMTLRLDGG